MTTLHETQDGLTSVMSMGGAPAVSFTNSGLQFTKNKLINGEVTRINQRAFNGTWSGKSVWETQPATIAGKEAAYGYDMWFRSNAARLDGTGASENMAQWIEAGNFRPSAVHTLSGVGVTTTNITSPASGNWKIIVAQGATNVQVEEGSVATPFELRSIRYEIAECQRYYTRFNVRCYQYAPVGDSYYSTISLPVIMRVAPQYAIAGTWTATNVGAVTHIASVSSYMINVGPTVSGMCGYALSATSEMTLSAVI